MQDRDDNSPPACSSTQPLKQPRFCCRCRNHGLRNPFKGHRQKCPYKTCPCDSCSLVVERQRIVAKQVALKRRQEAEKRKASVASPSSCVLEMTGEEDVTCMGDEQKRRKCVKNIQQLYPTPEIATDQSSLPCSPSSLSPSSHSSSPAIEISSSDYTNECEQVVKVEQVIFRPSHSVDDTFIYAPATATNSNAICSIINKDRPDIVESPELDAFQSCSALAGFTGSYSGNNSVCTANAPSYGVSPGVVASGTTTLSKMFPYDNNSVINKASDTGILGFNTVTPSVTNTYNANKMTVLMRIFPEHKPQLMQAILDSCNGDPIQCIETILNLQDGHKGPPVTQARHEERPFSPPYPIPVLSPMYIHHPSQTSTASVFSAPNQCTPALSEQQLPRMPTISATAPVVKAVNSSASLTTDKCRVPGISVSCPSIDAGYHTGPLHFAGAIAHQSMAAGATVAYPETPTPNLYLGTTPFQDGLRFQKSFASMMCPSIAGAAPQLAASGFYPIQPMTPSTPISMPITGFHRKTQEPHQTSTHTPMAPTQTTQMYCQTIGQIQPGKCLSYTASLQAAAIANPAGTPIMLPVLSDTGINQVTSRNNPQTSICDNQASGGTSGAFCKWFDTPHQPTPLPVTCVSDVATTHQSAPSLLQFSTPLCKGTDAVAAQALVALRTSPLRRKTGADDSTTINDLLLQDSESL